MSTTESNASTRSVVFQGDEMTVDQMVDTIIREVQSALNGLQVSLRNLCALDEQEVDPDEDFKEAVALEDASADLIVVINSILKELQPVVAELRGKPPSKESRAWLAEHKKGRKAQMKRVAEERKTEPAESAA
jgi:hypothetical protein